MPAPLCRIRLGGIVPHLSQIAAGFTLLEQKGLLRLEHNGLSAFKRSGIYTHNIILEAQIGDAVLAYDMADGYESILDKEEFGRQLERVTFYFKRSYDPKFHEGMQNQRKMRPLGLNYHVTCPGNFIDAGRPSLALMPEDYMSHNSYTEYRGLFLARLWNPEGVRECVLQKQHPAFSHQEISELAERTDRKSVV